MHESAGMPWISISAFFPLGRALYGVCIFPRLNNHPIFYFRLDGLYIPSFFLSFFLFYLSVRRGSRDPAIAHALRIREIHSERENRVVRASSLLSEG